MNIGVHRFFWIGVSRFSGYCPNTKKRRNKLVTTINGVFYIFMLSLKVVRVLYNTFQLTLAMFKCSRATHTVLYYYAVKGGAPKYTHTIITSECFKNTFRWIKKWLALARWLSWLERRTMHQVVAGSIPGQGTYLGCRFNPWLGPRREVTDPCLSSSLSKINKNVSSGEDFFF